MNWEEIREEWETTKITLAALAEKYDVKLGTLKSKKSRDAKDGNEWVRNPTKKVATKSEKVATIKKKDASVKTVLEEGEEAFVESDELTDKQRLFCIYYVKSFNQTMAAIKAGYAPESAHVEGSRLLRNAKVSAEIKRIKEEMTQGIFIDAMDVLNKYIKIAFADITDYVSFGRKEVTVDYDREGEAIKAEVNYVDFKESAEIDGTIVTEVKQGKDGVSIKIADKMKALDMLTKYFDLLSENDKKKLQEEKLKVDIAKGKAEVEKISNKGDTPIEIVIKRKSERS
ncbi:terminase small subunit [Metabacillus fastidiosus]|uniref:terminase small subunit n=1 Tax=Metabacillus fastidiosus TaxID=1458 RepID=UPI003D299AD2